mgnify:CR=1 FL=1
MLSRNIITQNDINELDKKAEAEVQAAVAYAEAGTWEPVEDLLKFVYSENNS